jgi:hypothetical protein
MFPLFDVLPFFGEIQRPAFCGTHFTGQSLL